MFQRQWFTIVGAAPANCRKVRFWDMAATEEKRKNDPDWTVGALVGEKDGIYYLIDIQRTRATPKGVEDLIAQTAELDGKPIPVFLEQEPGASGKSVIDHYARRVLLGYTFRGRRSTGNKEARAEPVSSAAEADNVKLVKGAWNAEFLDEIGIFPAGAHDDQVDALSGAVAELTFKRPEVTKWSTGGKQANPWKMYG